MIIYAMTHVENTRFILVDGGLCWREEERKRAFKFSVWDIIYRLYFAKSHSPRVYKMMMNICQATVLVNPAIYNWLMASPEILLLATGYICSHCSAMYEAKLIHLLQIYLQMEQQEQPLLVKSEAALLVRSDNPERCGIVRNVLNVLFLDYVL